MAGPTPFGENQKSGIFSSFDLLNPIVTELSGIKGEKTLELDIGAQEAGYSITASGATAQVTFSYYIDNDNDSKNGRLLLSDSFEVDLKNKKLLSFKREVQGNQASAFWTKASQSLKETKSFTDKSPEVKKFFQKVVLKLPLPAAQELPVERAPEAENSRPVKRIEESAFRMARLPNYRGMQFLSALVARSEQVRPHRSQNVWTRYAQKTNNYLSSGQFMLDARSQNFVSTASSPEMIGALFSGSLGFQLGRAWGASFAVGTLGSARLLSTGMGLMLEVPAFELAGRSIRACKEGSFDSDDLASSMLKDYFTFGAFRGVGAMSRSPIASFAALHGMNELERYVGLQPAQSDYIQRIADDGVLFAQLSFASQMSEATLGKALGIHSSLYERAHETQMAALKDSLRWKNDAELVVSSGLYKQDGQHEFPVSGRKAYLNPERLGWILGSPDANEGFFPDALATQGDAPPLYVFKDDAGKYFVQRLPGKEALNANYYDKNADAWVPIDRSPVALADGMQIKAGPENIFKINLREGKGRPVEQTILPPAVAPIDTAVEIPVMFLEDLTSDKRILATDEQTIGAPLRERKASYFIPGFGEVSAFTSVGIDKKVLLDMRKVGINEDAFGFFLDSQGRPVLIVADGTGGHGAGDFASARAVNTMAEVLRDGSVTSLADAAIKAHEKIVIDVHGGKTVLGALRVNPDGSVEHVGAGDIHFWILRTLPDGTRTIIEPHLPDTQSAFGKRLGAFKSRIEMNSVPGSSVVLSSLGKTTDEIPSTAMPLLVVSERSAGTQNQLLYQEKLKINVGTEAQPVWQDLILQEGDQLILMSDGVGAQADESQFLDYTNNASNASGTLDAMENYTNRAFDLYKWRLAQTTKADEKVLIPTGQLYAGLHMEGSGSIYKAGANAGEWNLIAHVGPDNATALVYRHNPQKRGVQNPVVVSPPPNVPEPTSPIALTPPPATPNNLPIEAPVIRLTYGSTRSTVTSPDSLEVVFGKSHQAQLFGDEHTWVSHEHFKIEYVLDQGVWKYRLSHLVDSGLWLENQQTGKKRISKILKKGEWLFLPPDEYEIKFKKSDTEWDDILSLSLPVINVIKAP